MAVRLPTAVRFPMAVGLPTAVKRLGTLPSFEGESNQHHDFRRPGRAKQRLDFILILPLPEAET
jgi:hypothetical protein